MPNENLYEQLKDQLSKLHDKEIVLSSKDNDAVVQHLKSDSSAEGNRLKSENLQIKSNYPLPKVET